MRVDILECRRWEEGNDVTNRRVLIDLIKGAEIQGNLQPDGRILVLSRFKPIINSQTDIE